MTNTQSEVHCSPFIGLCLGSIGMDSVIGELFYKGAILQRIYRKMTILWSFSYNSFVKFHDGKIIREPQHDCVISKPCFNKVCYNMGLNARKPVFGRLRKHRRRPACALALLSAFVIR